MTDLSKSTQEWQKVLKTNKGVYHADNYEVGYQLHGWTIVLQFGENYWYWAGPNVIQGENT